jgi:CDGSH-type Zn-finger protein
MYSMSRILTLEALREHLQVAIELEHATLPPYLTALYSIKSGTNDRAVEVLTSVFVEEMLHMCLAANVLNAVGGRPVIDEPEFTASYPTALPHSKASFEVHLSGFTPETLEIFARIEKPEEHGARAESENYETIGQFYQAIENGLKHLCATLGEDAVFSGDPSRQITPEHLHFDGTQKVVAVYDLKSALRAIDEIEEQGEGLKHASVWDGDHDMFHPERDEVAHYFRFIELQLGQSFVRGDTPQSGPSGDHFEVDFSEVHRVRTNCKLSDLAENSPARQLAVQFNVAYFDMLRRVERALNGQQALLNDAISQMFELRELARSLMATPSGDGITNAAPTFEYVAASSSSPSRVRVSVTRNGPYVVEGLSALVRKSTVYSEYGEPLTWRKDDVIAVDAKVRLCRCGHSSAKPLCDGTHARVGFDGTESASTEPSASRQERLAATQIAMTDDRSLCVHAGYCGNRVRGVWEMIESSDDTQVRFQLMHMVEQCPSGRLTYELDGVALEPDLPEGVAVTKDGPYWLTGGVDVTMSDGRQLETRNRMTLCRCGQSNNKPLCDGTHKEVGFVDG